MQLIINGLPAFIKEGSSFEYIRENRLFTGAEDYTMSITLPLKGCAENEKIFGLIHRKSVEPKDLIFECELRDREFYKFGAATITELTESEVKIQFLEGKSKQNFDASFDDVYINELTLGGPSITDPLLISPREALDPFKSGLREVCLPWINSGNDDPIIHNDMEVEDENSHTFKWGEEVEKLSWQPYLLHLTKLICDAVGYSYDFDAWEIDLSLRFFLVCNTLPPAWEIDDYSRILPHWSVDEYFENLAVFLGGEFDIDHRSKKIQFYKSADRSNNAGTVFIDEVEEVFNAEVTVDDPKCDFMGARNFKYADNGASGKFDSCKWFIDQYGSDVKSYDTLDELIQKNVRYKRWMANYYDDPFNDRVYLDDLTKLLYAKDVDCYYILRTLYAFQENNVVGVPVHYIYCILQPVNEFGPLVYSDNAEEEELKFVPVALDFTSKEKGACMFLSMGSFAENYSDDTLYWGKSDNWSWWQDDETPLPVIEQKFNQGEKEKNPEYYNVINIGWWSGSMPGSASVAPSILPHPFVSRCEVDYNWNLHVNSAFNLRLNDGSFKSRFSGIQLDIKRKYTFRFLSDVVMDPRAVYIIAGKKYLCESLTYNFTEKGRSQEVKGVFWAFADE